MRRPHGFGIIVEPDRPTIEFDTVTCAHCNCFFRVKPREDPTNAGGFCRQCMDYLCGPCADKGTCTPFEKQVEEMEARDRFMRSAGLL
jgi:hypothetical protein